MLEIRNSRNKKVCELDLKQKTVVIVSKGIETKIQFLPSDSVTIQEAQVTQKNKNKNKN
ncbi:hypothetical protein ACQV2X_06240 [Facklamia sp. P12945]